MSILLLILGVVLFIGLVVVHEWGHFIAARRGGVEVEEFGIGFPPKIWAKKVETAKSKFLFTVNALPLGGFVRLKGENDAADAPGSFGAAPLSTKVKILLAGVVMNLITAFAIFTFLAATGMPKLIANQFTVSSDTKVSRQVDVAVNKVIPNQPADRAGIRTGDKIISVDGQQISRLGELSELSKKSAGKQVDIVIQRGGEKQTLLVDLNKQDTGEGYLGVETDQSGIQLQKSTWSAPIVGAGLTAQLTQLTFKGLGTAISSLFVGDAKKASEQVSGPVGIAAILNAGSKIGVNFILMVIGIISLSLAIMNILPIPALDGGRLFVLLLFRALKKPLTKNIEEAIHATGFMALMVLFVLITIVDVKRFF